jgi:hypothetical protein
MCSRSACTLIRIKDVDNLYAGPVGYRPVRGNKYPPTKIFMTQHASTMNHGPTAICHSSEEGYFIMWTQTGHPFMRISYAQIRLSIADIYCCVMICS